MTTFSQVKDYALTNLPGLCIGIRTDGSASGTINWVAELLRRINYCPASADLGDTHIGWHFRLVKPIKDPKAALRTYKLFANAMSGDMLTKVFQHLQLRVASGSGAAPAMVAYVAPEPEVEDSSIDPNAPLVATLEDAMQINGVQPGGGLLRNVTSVWDVAAGKVVSEPEAAPVIEEAIDAVVDRLLAVAPVDDEQWGAW